MNQENILKSIEDLLNNRLEKQDSEFVDSTTACEFFNISKQTLYHWNNRGLIRYSKPSGTKKIYYNKKDLVTRMMEHPVLSKADIDNKVKNFINNKNS